MVRLELDQVVMRRMREDDIEMIKDLIKVGTTYADQVLDRLPSYELM